MANDMVPISDEQAKAIQETLKLSGQTLETARALGSYLARILGTVPEDIVGLMGGDWLRAKRAENIVRLMRQAREKLEARHVEPEPVSLSVALPLLHAAADEDRDELVELWARLLASAMDPSRRGLVRQSFIEKIKKMDPLDAVILERMGSVTGNLQPSVEWFVANQLNVPGDQVSVSFHNLFDLELIGATGSTANWNRPNLMNAAISATGRAFLAAVQP